MKEGDVKPAWIFHGLFAVDPCSRYLSVEGLLPTLALLVCSHEICGKYLNYGAICLMGWFWFFGASCTRKVALAPPVLS